MAGGKDASAFRPEARNINEGRNDRKGYLGEVKPNSMFDDAPNKVSNDFRPEGRVGNVHEGRNDRKGYIGEIKPNSMFAEVPPSAQEEDAPSVATPEEVAICMVSTFDDVWAAFDFFDTNSNGSVALGEFTFGMQRLGFTVKDSKHILREMKGSLAVALTRSDFTALWRVGGGTVTPVAARSASPLGGDRFPSPSPANVKSFGAFLDSDPAMDAFNIQDLEDPVLVFARWAQGKWHILMSIFGYQDTKGVMAGRQKVKASDFVNFIRGQGFEGNAARVFAEIQKEGPHLDRSKAGEDGEADEDRDDITMAQLVHFQQRAKALVETMKVGDEGSPANRLIKLLKEKRGCLLRAWRLDLDVRGSGRVGHSDFVVACRQLGIPSEAKQIWSCFRPDSTKPGSSAPLELADLDGEEAANVDQFAECLWSNFGFDLDNAWAAIDTCARKMVTLEEWVHGTKNLGFEGNARLLFQGLGNLGRLWRNDFDYMNVLSKSSMRAQHSATPVKSLQSWVQNQFEGSSTVEKVNALLSTLGFPEEAPPRPGAKKEQKPEEVRLSVSDLSARLTALGYPHDALQASMIAARTGRGTHITRESLYTLLIGKRPGAPPRRHSRLLRAASAGQLEKGNRTDPSKIWRPRKVWKDSVDNISLLNDKKPACVRNYFSVPSSKSGFSISDRHVHEPERSSSPKPQNVDRSVSPIQARIDSNWSSTRGRAQSSSPPRPQRLNSSKQASPPRKVRPSAIEQEALRDRPGWDNSLYYSSEVNNRISKYVREYFGERERPVKEEMNRRRMIRKTMIVQQSLGASQPVGVSTGPPPSVGSPRFGTPPPATRDASPGAQAAMQLMVGHTDQSSPRTLLGANRRI